MNQQIVDLHIHSHYSRATSKNSTIEGLYYWGKIKGITVQGTGDFTHPMWFAEMKEKLEVSDGGLYRLKPEIAQEIDKTLPESVRDNQLEFSLTVEISNIYSKGGKVRKVHNCIVVPDFKTALYINTKLQKIGNLAADGRPILGMDSKDLLEITLEAHDNTLFFPAHIWTPWFAMFGSKSGFDSIEEAFEDLAPEVKAIETGLSSDPFMNWRINELQKRTILSNSDAHSPQKLGREATIIATDLNYRRIIDAIKTNDERLVGTIEFFPQEGKYHYDGHRACNVCLSPEETRELNGICPVCHTRLTVGVDYRVGEIANHTENYRHTTHKTVEYIIPLPELISEMEGKGVNTKTVQTKYQEIIASLGNEFEILRTMPLEEINQKGFPQLAEVVKRLREGDVHIDPGYDGVYGKVKLFSDGMKRKPQGDQLSLL